MKSFASVVMAASVMALGGCASSVGVDDYPYDFAPRVDMSKCTIDGAPCPECDFDSDCRSDPARPRCDAASHQCFACNPAHDDCAVGTFCAQKDGAYGCAAGCRNDADCTMGTHCDVAAHACRACIRDEHCPAGKLCHAFACTDGCNDQHLCGGALACCALACLDVSADVKNCGGCDLACSTANATPACAAGHCTIASCAQGFGDCNSQPGDGCEVDLGASAANCGACNQACSAPNTTAACMGGACVVGACKAGYADCNNQYVDGCEINIANDVANCGACALACVTPNATPACAGGMCRIAACNMGRSDCDGVVANGCEADVANDSANCGACGKACSQYAVCKSGVCVNLDGVVDANAQSSGITFVRDPASGQLLIVYQDNPAMNKYDVKVARYAANSWKLSTAYNNFYVTKQGAAVDTKGQLFLALSDGNATWYATTSGGSWLAPVAIPGLPAGGPTLDVDAKSAAHVTANIGLNKRSYATNAAGAWVVTDVAGSSTGPASIIATPVVAMTFANWSGHTIYYTEAANWGAQTGLYTYGVDQGPPQSLQAFGGALSVAYMVTGDYSHYQVLFHSKPAGQGWSGSTVLEPNSVVLYGLDLAVDGNGKHYVAVCDNAGGARVYSDQSGGWKLTPLNIPYCEGSLDALATAGRLYLAYRGKGGPLTVASVDTAGL